MVLPPYSLFDSTIWWAINLCVNMYENDVLPFRIDISHGDRSSVVDGGPMCGYTIAISSFRLLCVANVLFYPIVDCN